MDDRQRFTTEQVLRGIQAYVDEQFGLHLHLNPNASVSEYYEIICENMGCPLDFLSGVGAYFGLRWSQRRWAAWLKLPRPNRFHTLTADQQANLWDEWMDVTSNQRTIRDLARYIARHAPGTSLEPTTVFGVECAPAGAFRGLCQLPELGDRRVAPSTPIRRELRASQIESLMQRSAWISGVRIKIVKGFSIWSDPLPYYLIPLVLLAFPGLPILFGVLAVHAPLPPLVVFLGGIAFGFYVLYRMNERFRNPLPGGVETFGDLARLIAAANDEARA